MNMKRRSNKMITFEIPKRNIFWFVFLMSTVQVSKQNDFPNDLIEIEDFVQLEADMTSKIQDYLLRQQERLDQLIIHLHYWKEWRISNIHLEAEYITIPQNIFHLFKISTKDFNELENIMTGIDYNRDDMGLDDIQLPTNDHFNRIFLSLIDVQYQYDLNAENIMNGKLMDLRLNESLSLDLCFFVGKMCTEYNYHIYAIDWLETCLSISSDEQFDRQIHKQIYPSYIFLNQTKKAYDHAKQYLKYDSHDISAMHTFLDFGSNLRKLDEENIFTLEGYRICRENHTNPTDWNLKCRYNHENSAFLKIAPLKEEELLHYPKILLYREIVYDLEIEAIKSESAKTMGVSRVSSTDGSEKLKGFIFRISETAFINNQKSFLPQLAKRMEDISDLSITSSEWWQVLNYAPGGFYIMHSDYLSANSNSVKIRGNRITTMLFYFNEVSLGGETVFPRIGVSVKPTKGLALVWSNVHPDGSENILLQHTACPVVIGEKWGFTQWMRSFNQKCLRKIYEFDPVFSHKTP